MYDLLFLELRRTLAEVDDGSVSAAAADGVDDFEADMAAMCDDTVGRLRTER